MKVYGYFRSSAAYRLRIALNLKGLDPDQAFIHLRKKEQVSPDYRRLNPMGLVPTMEVDGRILTQSLAIIDYLDETHSEPPLLPDDPLDRAWVRSIALTIACDIHPINNLRVLNHLKTDMDQSQEEVDRWYQYWIVEGLTGLEALLARDPRVGAFCFGDRPTLADICLVPQLFNAARMNCPLAPYPTLLRIVETANTLPAFQSAAPDRQPDAE